MDGPKFDGVVRLWGTGSRRAAIRLLVGAFGALRLASPTAVDADTKPRLKQSHKSGKSPKSPSAPARAGGDKAKAPHSAQPSTSTPAHRHHHHHHHPKGGGCAVQSSNGQLTLSFTVASPHDHLTLAHQTLQDPAGTLASQTNVQLAGQPLLQIATTVASATNITVDLQYGAAFTGIRHAVFRTNDGQTIAGEIDGRPIVPMSMTADPASLTFADGAPPPTITLDGVSHAALTALFQQAHQTAQGCQPPSAGSGSGNAAHRRAKRGHVQPSRLQAQDDPGHISDPEDSVPCNLCKAGCDVGFTGCLVGIATGCTFTLFGHGACIAIGVAGCGVTALTCVGLCKGSRACCPVDCGRGGPSTNGCCDQGETCLDPTGVGLCCSAGLQPCRNTSCCQRHDVCLTDGSCCPQGQQSCASESVCCALGERCQQGTTCCPPNQHVCGGRCCQPGESCLNGDGPCCLTEKFCGPVCCNAQEDCIDVSRGTCCGGLNHACGTECCAPDEQCIGGACCSQARACGGLCCPAGTVCQDPLTHRCGPCPNGTVSCTDLGANGCCPTGQDCCFVQGQGLVCCPADEECCVPLDGRPRGCYAPAACNPR